MTSSLDDLHLRSLQTASLFSMLLILIYFRNYWGSSVSLLLPGIVSLLWNQSWLSLYQSLFCTSSLWNPLPPYFSLNLCWAACPPLVGPGYITKNCFTLKPVTFKGPDGLGYIQLSEGSLRGLIRKISILKVKHFYYKKKNHPQIVKWVNLGLKTALSASGPKDFSSWSHSSETKQISWLIKKKKKWIVPWICAWGIQ